MPLKSSVVRLVAKLNTTGGDAFAGGGATFALVPGMVGAEIELDAATATQLSDTSIGTLRRGRYRYVLTDSAGTATPARGGLAFTPSSAYFALDKVHTDGGATLDGKTTGVFLSAVTKGNFCWIQVAGDASVLFTAGITATTDGGLVTVKTTTNTADNLADATAVATALPVKGILGVSIGTQASSTIGPVLLKGLYTSQVV